MTTPLWESIEKEKLVRINKHGVYIPAQASERSALCMGLGLVEIEKDSEGNIKISQARGRKGVRVRKFSVKTNARRISIPQSVGEELKGLYEIVLITDQEIHLRKGKGK